MGPETCRQVMASVLVTVMGDGRSSGGDGGRQCHPKLVGSRSISDGREGERERERAGAQNL